MRSKADACARSESVPQPWRHAIAKTTSNETKRPAPAGQLAGLLHPTGDLSFVELVGFPHVEGTLRLGRKVDREERT